MKSNSAANNSSDAACHKPKSKYITSFKKLQAHAEHQELLIQQAKEQTVLEHEQHRVLADGICQQKVVYELLIPLHHEWMQQPVAEDCTSSQWLRSCADGVVRPPGSGWDTLVSLVASCNSMLAAILQATPQQVQEVMTITLDQLCDVHSALFMELLVLLEMISPQRYHGNEPVLPSSDTQAAVGDLSAEGPASGSEAAAGEAIEAAERMAELIRQSMTLGGLLVLHRPALLLEMCTINVATRQLMIASMGHFVKAAERLKLSNEQITHFRLMLHQYNRGMQAQLKKGLELLQMSKESTTQLSLKGEDGSQDTSEGAAREQAAGTKAAARTSAAKAQEASKRAGNGRAQSRSKSQQRTVQEQERREARGEQRGQVDGDGDEDSSAAAADSLAEQMQQHLSDRWQLMQLMGFWVANTLSSTQFAQFMVYSYPFYPLCSALAEGAALLPSPDGPTSAEVDAFMRKRRAGMQLEFEWLVQHTPELAEQCMAEGDEGGADA